MKGVPAIAGEMVGFIWAIARAVTASSSGNGAVQGREGNTRLDPADAQGGNGTRWGTLVACCEPTQATLASLNKAAQDETTAMR